MLAEWEFDNNLIENVSNAVTTADQSPTYTTGYANRALLFDVNANQSLTSSHIALVGISFTIDAWIYPTGFPNLQEHIVFSLCPSQGTYDCLYLSIHVDSGNYIPYLSFFGDDCPGSTSLTVNEWTHVAFVFEPNSLTQSIYVNGKLDATRTAAGPFKANSGSVTIGGNPLMSIPLDTNYFQVGFYCSFLTAFTSSSF